MSRFLLSISLALGLLFQPLTPSFAETFECPSPQADFVDSANAPTVSKILFNGQILERVLPQDLSRDISPEGVVGCYRYFSKNTGQDLLWDLGSVSFDGEIYRWTNAAGASWNLIPDFANDRFITDETNPYFEFSRYATLVRVFRPSNGDSHSCKPRNLTGYGLGFPVETKRDFPTNPRPLVLGILIDFSEGKASSPTREFSRFEVKKVENFFKVNSGSRSNLKIDVHPTVVRYPAKSSIMSDPENHPAVFENAIDSLRSQADLRKYSGYVFASSQTGPRLGGGYVSWVNEGVVGGEDRRSPIVWMGGINRFSDSVAPWKILAHEVGHMYGLPDLYLTQGDNAAGKTVGPFDIMDAVRGTSNSLNFMNRWMLGWIDDSQVDCRIADKRAFRTTISPVNTSKRGKVGVIVPLSENTAILIEARVRSALDNLTRSQEGILVYYLDSSIPGGQGPLKLIPSKNRLTQRPGRIDDEIRFQNGALRVNETVSYAGVSVKFTKRSGTRFTIAISKRG